MGSWLAVLADIGELKAAACLSRLAAMGSTVLFLVAFVAVAHLDTFALVSGGSHCRVRASIYWIIGTLSIGALN
jgi:hypothetical protein